MVRENSYKESMQFVKSLNEEAASKEVKRIQEKVDKIESWKKQYHNIIHDRIQRERFHGRLLESCRNDALSSAIKAIYISSLENYCGLSDDETALAESIVENWVAESGGAEVILSTKNQHRSYLIARLAQIVEDAAKRAVMEVESIEEADDDKEDKKDDKQKVDDKKEEESKEDKKEDKEEPKEEKPAKEESKEDKEDEDYGDGETEEGDFPDEDLDKDTDNDDEEDEEEAPAEEEEDYSDEIDVNMDDNDDENDNSSTDYDEQEDDSGDEESSDDTDEEESSEEEVVDDTNDEEVSKEEEDEVGEEILDDDPNEDEDDEDVTDTEDDSYEDDSVDSDRLYKDLEDEEDVKKAVDTIQTRVADAEEKFIKKNAEDKKKVDELLHKINNSVKTVEEIDDDDNPKSQAEQEHVMMYKRQISDLANRAPKGIFEAMANEISKSTYLAESAKAQITEYATENVDTSPEAIIGKTRILYGFLETLNTLRLEDVNENYIKKVIEEIN